MAVSRAGRLFVWGGNRWRLLCWSRGAPISMEGVLWVLQGYSRVSYCGASQSSAAMRPAGKGSGTLREYPGYATTLTPKPYVSTPTVAGRSAPCREQ